MSADAWIVLVTIGVMIATMVRGVLSPPAAIVAATAAVRPAAIVVCVGRS